MKKTLLISLIALCLTGMLYADFKEDIKNIDKLHDAYDHTKAATAIEEIILNTKDVKQQAQLYWRLSRAYLYQGDISEEEGKPKNEILALFTKGEELAEKSIQLDPSNPDAYFWKSTNIGRWGQVKGIMDSLFKTKPMRDLLETTINKDPEKSDAYDVLGQLYELVPGIPLSFGNSDYAVSLGRKAVALNIKNTASGKEEKIKYSQQHHLANHLYKRNWNSKKRDNELAKKKKNFDSNSDLLKQSCYYEGTVQIQAMSDREEAMIILKEVITGLESIKNRTRYQENDLKEAKKTLAEWGG